MINQPSQQSGFALLLSVIVASVVLAIGLTMLNIAVKQLTLTSVNRESEYAFQAATSGQECMRFWRQINADNYDGQIVGASAPAIGCFDSGTVNIQSQAVLDTTGDNYTNGFSYQVDWSATTAYGTEARCTEMDMYIMVASTSDYTIDFSSSPGGYITDSVGVSGIKTCDVYNKCTVAISRGYNRACADISSNSLLIVEREITSEF